mmetsp:Transcript_23284/g.52285  ORF Transcript_23284/g.52285 Transcript_23284/m.52285 type:complete len:254 (-) Transcript_23284:162-923(-)
MVRNSHVRRVQHVLEEEVPTIGHVSDAPRKLLCPALQFRILQLRDQVRALQRALDRCIAPRLSLLPPNPQQPLRFHGRKRQRASTLAGHESIGLLLVCLRDLGALALGIESPAMVGAEQRAVLLDPPFAQRGQSVWAGVLEHVPLVCRAVIPHDQVVAEQLDSMRLLLVQEFGGCKRIPLLLEVELLPRVPGLQLVRIFLVVYDPVLHSRLHEDARTRLWMWFSGKCIRTGGNRGSHNSWRKEGKACDAGDMQ